MTRPYLSSDYSQLKSWWIERKHLVLPQGALAPIGSVVDNKAMGFLYTAGTSLGQIAWITTNPMNTPKESHTAISQIVSDLVQKGKSLGLTHLVGFSDSRGLTKIYNKAGLMEARPHTFSIGVY